MIEVTLKDILNARNTLAILTQQKMDLKTAYDVGKIIRKANTELEAFAEVRDRILKEQTDKDLLEQEIVDALEAKVELPVNKISIERLAGVALAPAEAMVLEPFIDFD